MAAKLQNVLVVVLLVAMGSFIVFGMPKVDYSAFNSMSKIIPNGLVGFLTGAS